MPLNATSPDNSGDLDAIEKKRLTYAQLMMSSYGIVDGFNAGSSSIRLAFDILYKNNNIQSANALRNWMLTPEGAIFVTAETLILTGFSFFTSLYPNPDENSVFKTAVADPWNNILRPTLKSLKNAYKGVRGLIQTLDKYNGLNTTYLIIPLWIVLGALSAYNRHVYLQIDKTRKKIKKENEKLLKQVKAIGCGANNQSIITPLSFNDNIYFSNKIVGYISKGYGGIIDGLYLYIGAAVIMSFTPEVFLIVAIYSSIFVLVCIATRLYEEHNKQKDVYISQDELKLEICRQELKNAFVNLKNNTSPPALDDNRYQTLKLKMQAFLECRHERRLRLTRSNAGAILAGLTDGLAVYGAISAFMFSIYTIALMLSLTFPPAIIVASVTIGIYCLIAFTTYRYITNCHHTEKLNEIDIRQNNALSKLITRNENGSLRTSSKTIIDTIDQGTTFESHDATPILTTSEVFRAGFSAIGKGPKTVEFIFSSLQEPCEDGRNHDTTLMLWLMVPITLFYVYALGVSSYFDPWDKKNKGKISPTINNARPISRAQSPVNTNKNKSWYRFYNQTSIDENPKTETDELSSDFRTDFIFD